MSERLRLAGRGLERSRTGSHRLEYDEPPPRWRRGGRRPTTCGHTHRFWTMAALPAASSMTTDLPVSTVFLVLVTHAGCGVDGEDLSSAVWYPEVPHPPERTFRRSRPSLS